MTGRASCPTTAGVCYSAMVEQSVKSLGIRFAARIQLDLFEDLFQRRLRDSHFRIPKAMERDFLEPNTEAEERIRDLILAYRGEEGQRLEIERKKQRERLAAAERALARRATKKALEEARIAGNKLRGIQLKLDDLLRSRPEPRDTRVFPLGYVPVVVSEGGERLVRPMRYHLRPRGRPANFDSRFPGLYNARRDNLTGFWREQFGLRHGVFVVTSFFENVARHDYEHRLLAPGEPRQNLVVRFSRQGKAGETLDLTIACLWDRWSAPEEPDLLSFAAITDDPPAEVLATGHDRCIVALRPQHISPWLSPADRRDEELFRILGDREPLVFSHEPASQE